MSQHPAHPYLPLITSLAGCALTASERDFIRTARPFGIILMGRNCHDRAQVRTLTDAVREAAQRDDFPILIDQEGGRVQRLGPPHWPRYRPAGDFAAPQDAAHQATCIAQDLKDIGINVNCAPVLDIPIPGAHDVIGNRAFRTHHAAFGRAVVEAYLAASITPILKHIPGHGRAHADSHHVLPVVEADKMTLQATDFAPFKALASVPGVWAMTAHLVYSALDPYHPASASPAVIKTIRKDIGFNGILVSDDIEMAALAAYGDAGGRAQACLAAGCDVVLYCAGDLATSQAIAQAI